MQPASRGSKPLHSKRGKIKRSRTQSGMRITDRDIAVMGELTRHHILPSHYLYAATKHLGKDATGFRKRLLALQKHGYLDRTSRLNRPNVFTDFLIYKLGEKAPQTNEYTTPVGGGDEHAFMTACITFNIALEATRAGFRFITQEEILASARCPLETKHAKKPLQIPTQISYTFKGKKQYTSHSNAPTEPDQLFGIDYGKGFMFFALEADRGTEPLTRNNLDERSILKKILAYKNILETKAYSRFGIPNLYPMFVTTAADRVTHMAQLAAEIFPKGSPDLLFNFIEGFQFYYKTPPLFPHLFKSEWSRAGKAPFLINRP